MFFNFIWMHMGTNSSFMEVHTRGLQKAFITYSNLHDTCTLHANLNGNKSLPRIKCGYRISFHLGSHTI